MKATILQMTPQSDLGEDAYGFVLFRHLQTPKYLYIPIDGPIHFFSPHKREGRIPEAVKLTPRAPLEIYQPISLPTLRAHYKYNGSIWQGQIAGLVEINQAILNDSEGLNDTKPDDELLAMVLEHTHFPDLRNMWMSAALAANDVRVIRIPFKEFLSEFIYWPKGDSSLFKKSDEETDVLIGRRCLQELSLRQAESLSFSGLVEKDQKAAVLAMHLLNHYLRTGVSHHEASNAEVTWMLGEYFERRATDMRKELNKIAGHELVSRSKGKWKCSNIRELRSVYKLILEKERKAADESGPVDSTQDG